MNRQNIKCQSRKKRVVFFLITCILLTMLFGIIILFNTETTSHINEYTVKYTAEINEDLSNNSQEVDVVQVLQQEITVLKKQNRDYFICLIALIGFLSVLSLINIIVAALKTRSTKQNDKNNKLKKKSQKIEKQGEKLGKLGVLPNNEPFEQKESQHKSGEDGDSLGESKKDNVGQKSETAYYSEIDNENIKLGKSIRNAISLLEEKQKDIQYYYNDEEYDSLKELSCQAIENAIDMVKSGMSQYVPDVGEEFNDYKMEDATPSDLIGERGSVKEVKKPGLRVGNFVMDRAIVIRNIKNTREGEKNEVDFGN